jgi:hypothetical protein
MGRQAPDAKAGPYGISGVLAKGTLDQNRTAQTDQHKKTLDRPSERGSATAALKQISASEEHIQRNRGGNAGGCGSHRDWQRRGQ